MLSRKLIWVVVSSALAVASANAQDALTDRNALVQEDDVGFIIEAPDNAMLQSISIKVMDNAGNIVHTASSLGEPLVFDPDGALPDGEYRMVVETTVFLDEATRAKVPANPETITSVKRVKFNVSGGLKGIEIPADQANSEAEPGLLMKGLASVVDFLVGDASADITTAPDGDLIIEDDSPTILFRYGANTSTTDGVNIWWLTAQENGTLDADFTIYDAQNGSHIVRLEQGAAADTLDIMSNGDVGFFNGGAFWDDSATMLIIGDSTSAYTTGVVDLELKDTLPYFVMTDTDGDGMGQYVQGDYFSFESRRNVADPFRVHLSAPGDSIVINDSGTVGFSQKIHVGSNDAPVGQFTITSAAQPRFEMNDTTTGERWRFAIAADKFAINQLINAGTEFQVFNNGDVLIGGALTQNSDRDAKQDITAVDHLSVLDRIVALPISEWSYKDAPNQRHIGPMAQDFYSAFGLGRDDKGISTIDTSGVALAGIKALKWQNDRLAAENAELKARVEAMETRQVEIMATLATLKAELSEPAPVVASLQQ